MVWRSNFKLSGSGCPNPMDISRCLQINPTDILCEYSANHTNSALALLDLSGNGRDMAAANSPAVADTNLIDTNGNRLRAFQYVNASSQYHSLAHASWMNCFTTDHTITILAYSSVNAKYFFSHGVVNVDGVGVATNGNKIEAVYNNSSATPTTITAATAVAMIDSYLHLIQITRRSDVITLTVDGLRVATVSGVDSGGNKYGKDVSRTMYIGAYTGPASYLTGQIAYFRLMSRAMTDAELYREWSLLNGVWSGSGIGTIATATRASTAERLLPDRKRVTITTNWMRGGRGVNQSLLLEPAVTNWTYSNDFSNAAWVPTGADVPSPGTSVVRADGTTVTTNCLREDGGNTEHKIARATAATAVGTNALYQTKLKYNASAGTPREWVYLKLTDGTVTSTCYFNIRRGVAGTADGTATVKGYGIEPAYEPDGQRWWKCWVWLTSQNNTAGSAEINIATADAASLTFVGAGVQDSVFICDAQFESSNAPTSFVPTTTSTVTRATDSLTVLPYRLRSKLHEAIGLTPTMYMGFEQETAGTTITSSDGGSTWTKNGQPLHYEMPAQGHYHQLNGSADWWRIANADAITAGLYPSGSFSIVFSLTPPTATGTKTIISNFEAAGTTGYLLYQNANKVTLEIYDGSGSSSVTSVATFSGNDPLLGVITYQRVGGAANNVVNIYLNNTAVTTSSTMKLLSNGTNGVGIGATYAGSYKSDHKLHYLAQFNGTVISASQVTALYNAWKEDGVLPIVMSSTTHQKKIRVKGEYRYAVSSALAGLPGFLAIGGNGGYGDDLAASNKNVLKVYLDTTGIYFSLRGVDTTDHYMYKTGMTHDVWNTFDVTFDLTNLALSSGTVNGSAVTLHSGMTGTASIYFNNTKIYPVATYTGSTYPGFEMKNLEILTE